MGRIVPKTGRELGVETVLSGRIFECGDSLAIDVELDDVGSGKQVWGWRYMGKSSELLTVQRDIAKEISQRMQLQLSAADRQKLKSGNVEC